MRRRASSTSWSRPVRSERVDAVLVSGDVYDRALPSVDAGPLQRRAAPARRHRDAGGADQRQPRLGPPARLRRRPDRRRGHPPAHRPGAVGTRCCCPTRTGRSRSTPCPTSSLMPSGQASAVERSHRRCSARRCAGSAPTWPGAARHPVGGPGARVRHRRRAVGQRARHQRRRGVARSRRRPSTGSTTPRWATCTARRRLAERVRYSGSPGLLLLRGAPPQGAAAGRAAAAGRPASVEQVPTPVPRPLARVRGRLDDLLTDRAWAARDHYLQVTLTDRGPPSRADGAAAAALPRTCWCSGSHPTAAPAPVGSAAAPAARSQRPRGRRRLRRPRAQRPEPDPAESALLAEAFEAVRLAEASA